MIRPVFPALWLSARGVGVLVFLSVLLGLAGFVRPLLVPVMGLFAAFVVLLVVDVARGPAKTALRVERAPLGFLALRRPGELAYAVENRSATEIRLGLIETPVPTIGFAADEVVARVAARSGAHVRAGYLPRERGAATFGDVYLWTENRIGLVRRRFVHAASERVRVFPDLSAIERDGYLARRRTLVESGLRRLKLRGTGTEFESLREYVPGDAFRVVDWKATARRGRLMVQQHEVERSQQVVVALDAGRLMWPRIGLQRKFDYALTAALSVARIAQAADDNVGLVAFAAAPRLWIKPRRGAAHVAALARAAYDLQPALEEPDYETFFTELRRRYTKRSLIVLFTDLFDPTTSRGVVAGIASLVARHLVVCVLANDAAIEAGLAAPPATAAEAYRTSAALMLADERAAAIATLRSRGVIIVDVPAQRLTVALLDTYLDIKNRNLL